MATIPNTRRDLQWGLQQIKSGTLKPHSLSFSLSQPTFCFQETEHSMTVNVPPETPAIFSDFLIALQTSSQLTKLDFHLVDWDPQQAQSLRTLLDRTTTIKQLAFIRNKINLTQLSEALRNNKCIEEITVSESCIGAQGAEELSKMIEVNATIKMLTVFDSKPIIATPLISAVLARNRAMEVHIWCIDRNRKSSKVVEFTPGNGTLRVYRVDMAGACRVGNSLGWNSTVSSLDMAGVRLKTRWAKEFRWVIEQNRTLKEVRLSKTGLNDKGVVYLAAGLFKNRTLEKLHLDGNSFGGVGIEHLLCPLTKFSPLQNQANTCLKSLTIGGGKSKIGRDGLSAIINMLTSNQSVAFLGIHNDESLKPDDVVQIFKSLERNAALRRLSLQGCKGVKGETVLQAIMETLNVNPWIEDIDLDTTPLSLAGKTQGICQRLGQNERTEEADIDIFNDMQMTMPKTYRVFLCGQEYAGKTTISNTISNIMSPSKVPYLDQVRILVNPVEQAVRAPGMRIKTLRDEDTKISIWNLAGQQELYSLHDLMFPGHGSASFFLIITSLFRNPSNREPRTSAEIEEDIQYWLRFVVSNSKRAVTQCMLPAAAVVLTHYDRINHLSEAVVTSLEKLREKFQGSVEFYPTVFTVDARSSASVSKLSYHVRKTSRTILERVPRVYQLCDDLVRMLLDWRRENHNRPVIKWKEFGDLCQVKVPCLRIRSRHDNREKVENRRRAVATNLHHIGEVIYFNEVELIILDLQWFCGEVINQLVRLDVRKQSSNEKSGFISRKEFEKILREGLESDVFENLEANDVVKMMLKLELCCERDPSDPDSDLLIPSNLEEGKWKPQKWQVKSAGSNYVGRRLQCDESSHVFLKPGFFPRLQVHLHNKIMGLRSQHGASYGLDRSLISININGMHVRVELGGQLGHFIDVLACSTKSPTEMLRLFQHLIIPAIQGLCHGITLMEYVVRSECVKNLIPPRNRKNQLVPLQQLKQALLSVPADGIYDYQHTWDSIVDSGSLVLGHGFDYARDLLSDDDFREVLHSRYHDLYNLAIELHVPQENEPDHPNQEIASSVEPTFAGIAKGVEAVLQRLKIIEQEIRDVKQEIQGLRYYEHRLLIELHRKMNYLINYNIQLEERKVPNMFYFVRTENYSRKLITNIITGMTALRLHMLCEFRREMHVVENQIGCELMQVDNITVKCLAPYMKKFMTLLTFALKIGAHLAVGMGEMIPDLGREVAHLTASPLLYGAAGAAAAGAVGIAAAGNMNRGSSSRDIQQDQRPAQQWVVDFLRNHRCSSGEDIAEKFGLWRVRYRDDGQIAWICTRHMHTRAYEIVQAPI